MWLKGWLCLTLMRIFGAALPGKTLFVTFVDDVTKLYSAKPTLVITT